MDLLPSRRRYKRNLYRALQTALEQLKGTSPGVPADPDLRFWFESAWTHAIRPTWWLLTASELSRRARPQLEEDVQHLRLCPVLHLMGFADMQRLIHGLPTVWAPLAENLQCEVADLPREMTRVYGAVGGDCSAGDEVLTELTMAFDASATDILQGGEPNWSRLYVGTMRLSEQVLDVSAPIEDMFAFVTQAMASHHAFIDTISKGRPGKGR